MEDLYAKVEKALDGVRSYLEADGGNVKIQEIDSDGTLKVEFLGSCVSCPMSSMTFKAGVEDAVLKNVPEIKKVIAINLN
ncbi:MAG: NifU family protein [Leadbetterella sp.]